jgi:N-acetylneuraminic acid mutarotase
MFGLGSTVFLFGGMGLGPYLGDTWQWANGTWTQMEVPAPSPREGAATAVLNGKVYLYGGSGTAGGFLSDTWEWDGAKWTQLTPPGPTPGGRYGHSMATLGNVIVLFGNVGGPTDTWTFDGTSWTQAATVGPTGNPGGLSESRCFQTMATIGNRVILFGGEQDANNILDDTWAWDGKTWTQLSVPNPPAARFHAGMTTLQNQIVMFGGAGAIPNGVPFLADTWAFDGMAWKQVATTGPPGRYGYVLAAF